MPKEREKKMMQQPTKLRVCLVGGVKKWKDRKWWEDRKMRG